jgi:hypothetical protein
MKLTSLFFRIIGLCGLLLIGNNALAVCAVSVNSVNLGVITIGAASSAVLSPAANCTLGTLYSYSFSSVNGGANGQLKSGASCVLSYNVVPYDAYTGVYGTANYFVTATPALTGTGAGQTANFGVVVSAAQGGCVLVPNAAALTVVDTLVVSVNY